MYDMAQRGCSSTLPCPACASRMTNHLGASCFSTSWTASASAIPPSAPARRVRRQVAVHFVEHDQPAQALGSRQASHPAQHLFEHDAQQQGSLVIVEMRNAQDGRRGIAVAPLHPLGVERRALTPVRERRRGEGSAGGFDGHHERPLLPGNDNSFASSRMLEIDEPLVLSGAWRPFPPARKPHPLLG